MAAVTNLLATPVANTAALTTYTTGSMTPTAGDLLVVLGAASTKNVAPSSITDSLGGTYVVQDFFLSTTSVDSCFIGVANQLASGSALTVSVNYAGAPTGCIVFVAKVTGMSKTGATAIKQHSGTDNGTSGTAPAATFGASVLTTNPTIGLVADNSFTAVTPPVSWTELGETQYATPNQNSEYAARDSGFTGTTITWGATRSAVWGTYIIELDASAVAVVDIPGAVMPEMSAA